MRVSLLTAAVLTLGVTPALAGYYTDECRDDRETWTLALDQDTGAAQFFKDTGKVRVGSYTANGDIATITADEMRITLHVAWGNASWRAGAAKGLLTCRFVSYDKPSRWQEARAYAPPPAPFVIPGEPLALAPAPASPPASSGDACDMQGTCYSVGNTNDRVPVTIDGDSATVSIHIGSLAFQALIDSGATSMALPETAADELIGSGDATEGEPTSVLHADGKSVERRTIIVNAVTIGGHVVHDVRTVIEPDGAMPLLGFSVLRQIAPKFAIDTTHSQLVFE